MGCKILYAVYVRLWDLSTSETPPLRDGSREVAAGDFREFCEPQTPRQLGARNLLSRDFSHRNSLPKKKQIFQ